MYVNISGKGNINNRSLEQTLAYHTPSLNVVSEHKPLVYEAS